MRMQKVCKGRRRRWGQCWLTVSLKHDINCLFLKVSKRLVPEASDVVFSMAVTAQFVSALTFDLPQDSWSLLLCLDRLYASNSRLPPLHAQCHRGLVLVRLLENRPSACYSQQSLSCRPPLVAT